MISILKILTGGGGVKNLENYADVICTWPLRVQHYPNLHPNSPPLQGARPHPCNLRPSPTKQASKQASSS